jgi:protein-disulfide isomerase
MNGRVAGAMVLALATASLEACSRHATAAECAALLDRYVELLVREQDPKAADTEIARQKELTRAKAANNAAFASCPNEVSAKGAHCAMSAVNVDEFEKCLE